MTLNERNPIFTEEAQELPEKPIERRPGGEQGVLQYRPPTGQESRHVTPFGTCQCGCGKPLDSPGRGTPRKYATPACRTRAYRRRRDRYVGNPPALPPEGSSRVQGELAK